MYKSKQPLLSKCEICVSNNAVDSWPGVCHTLLAFIISELGKKRPDASIHRVAKKFFQQADDSRKTSRPGMLLNRATRSFVAIQRIISTATLMTPLGQEFGNILRVHLLPVEQYAAAATPTSIQGDTSGNTNLQISFRPDTISDRELYLHGRFACNEAYFSFRSGHLIPKLYKSLGVFTLESCLSVDPDKQFSHMMHMFYCLNLLGAEECQKEHRY